MRTRKKARGCVILCGLLLSLYHLSGHVYCQDNDTLPSNAADLLR